MDNEFITLRYAATVQLLRYVSNDFANFYTILIRLCRCLIDLVYLNIYYYLGRLNQYTGYSKCYETVYLFLQDESYKDGCLEYHLMVISNV